MSSRRPPLILKPVTRVESAGATPSRRAPARKSSSKRALDEDEPQPLPFRKPRRLRPSRSSRARCRSGRRGSARDSRACRPAGSSQRDAAADFGEARRELQRAQVVWRGRRRRRDRSGEAATASSAGVDDLPRAKSRQAKSATPRRRRAGPAGPRREACRRGSRPRVDEAAEQRRRDERHRAGPRRRAPGRCGPT